MSDDRFTEENQRPFTKYLRLVPKKYPDHYSKQAPGTPVVWESLFTLIKESKTDTVPFKWLRRILHNYPDVLIWEAYAEWTKGLVHEKIFPIDAINISK